MGKTGSRKKRDLLSSSNGVHHINGRNPCLYHLFRIGSLTRVDRTSYEEGDKQNQINVNGCLKLTDISTATFQTFFFVGGGGAGWGWRGRR